MILNTAKINFWVVGITMILAGSFLLYLEEYRNSDFIFVIVYLLIFLGWMVLFMQVIKGTIVDAKKVPFSEDKVKFLQQGIAKFFAYIIVVSIIVFKSDGRRYFILDRVKVGCCYGSRGLQAWLIRRQSLRRECQKVCCRFVTKNLYLSSNHNLSTFWMQK